MFPCCLSQLFQEFLKNIYENKQRSILIKQEKQSEIYDMIMNQVF